MPPRRASIRSRRQISEFPLTPGFQVRRRVADSPVTPPARREIFPSTPRPVYRRFQEPNPSPRGYINQPDTDPGVSWYDDSDSDSSGPKSNIDQPNPGVSYDDDSDSSSPKGNIGQPNPGVTYDDDSDGAVGNIDKPYPGANPGDIVYRYEAPVDREGEGEGEGGNNNDSNEEEEEEEEQDQEQDQDQEQGDNDGDADAPGPVQPPVPAPPAPGPRYLRITSAPAAGSGRRGRKPGGIRKPNPAAEQKRQARAAAAQRRIARAAEITAGLTPRTTRSRAAQTGIQHVQLQTRVGGATYSAPSTFVYRGQRNQKQQPPQPVNDRDEEEGESSSEEEDVDEEK